MYLGGFWVDITGDVRNSSPVVWKRGRASTDVDDLTANTGTLSFVLDNSQANSGAKLGYYSYGHADCRAGFGPGALTRLSITYPTQITNQIIKTVAAIGTPEALAADGTFFQSATYIGIKAARTNNAGTVYLGIGATNDTQIIPIAPGEQGIIQAPPGQKFDLNDFYLDVETAGDGLGLIYS